MDTIVSIRDTLITCIAEGKQLPAQTTNPDIYDAVAFLLERAGTGLSVLRPTAGPVLDNLLKLDARAEKRARVADIWMGLRALGLKSGDTVGTSENILKNPIFCALVKASGLNATCAQKDTVQGVFDSAWNPAALAPNARSVSFQNGTLDIACNGALLERADMSGDPRGALARIDAHNAPSKTQANAPKPITYTVLEDATLSAFATEIFSSYTTRRIAIAGAKPHPTELVESAALASVLPPVPTYKPVLSPALLENGILSDVQVEAIIYAGQAHSNFLPAHPNDPNLEAPRQGFLVGHGTGFGKGRVAAGIIADNWAQGRKRHVWVSENPTLIEAATMHVAGGATVVPHCPADTQASRATALCTEGFSLVPLLKSPVAPWPKAAFSQVR